MCTAAFIMSVYSREEREEQLAYPTIHIYISVCCLHQSEWECVWEGEGEGKIIDTFKMREQLLLDT